MGEPHAMRDDTEQRGDPSMVTPEVRWRAVQRALVRARNGLSIPPGVRRAFRTAKANASRSEGSTDG